MNTNKAQIYFEHTLSNKSQKMLNTHAHDQHELYYLEKGKKIYFIGDELYLLEPGDLVFVPKGIYHKTDDDGYDGVERILLYFDNEFIGNESLKYINELTQNKLVRMPKQHRYILQEILRKIENENQLLLKDSQEMQRLYLKQLLILISRFRLHNNTSNFSELFLIIQDSAKYISTNYSNDLSLKTLAKKYAMSPCYFSKQFKSITGVGLNEYINISRISAAERLLTDTNLPIIEVAAECGFNDSNYFAAVFKKIKGITPKKYSLLHKEKPYR